VIVRSATSDLQPPTTKMLAVNSTTTVSPVTSRARIARLSAVAVLAAVVAGCATDAPQDTWQPAGPNAQQISNLDVWVFGIAGIVGVAVFSVLGFALWKYRDRGQPIPEQTHGKPALEIGLTILPALILIGIAIPTVGTIMDLAKTDDTECIINVTGQQWWWEVDYPVQDGCGGIEEPIVTSGQMVIETGTKVLVRGTSRDVIHSWWIPRLNGKRDMVPGRVHTVRLEADQPGIYAGQCTEFCGLSHANMRMEVIAMEPDDFAVWKANQLEAYASPEEGTLAAEGEAAFITQCSRCHQVDGLTDSDGELVVARPDQNVWSGAAPNLTNFMTRNTFAGASWDLLSKECRPAVWDADSADVGAAYLEGVSDTCLNEVELREWLRNAPAKKPMYTDPESLEATDGLPRGMPYLALSEDQIDQLIAYLLERK
jgi:cytochrome c oxidase subunit 2